MSIRRTGFTNLRYGARKNREQSISKIMMDATAAPTPLLLKEEMCDFLKRGGKIKKYAYKNPSFWQKTFNGLSKYDKRKK